MLFRERNSSLVEIDFAEAIDGFILYLATERGLSENYQLLTRRSLEKFANWAGSQKQLVFSAPDRARFFERIPRDRKGKRPCGRIDEVGGGRPEDFLPVFEDAFNG